MNQDEYDWHIVHTDSMADISPEFGEVEVNAHNYMETPSEIVSSCKGRMAPTISL